MAVEKDFVTLRCHIALTGSCGRHNIGSVWLRSAVMNLDNSLLQYLLSGMEKNALLLVDLYTPLYIDQEREQFFLSISRGSREPITVDKSQDRLTLSFYAYNENNKPHCQGRRCINFRICTRIFMV